ncbi:hypothetical protein KAFR_0A05470 [Kazachstania africana CBS 2517]|uniref:TLC domain-containing protein n=1 Tax=Kazachstania africana (strain ATCC 22294 / BCRC 22015 / CBS 2517 / CECT 1963 / NBRC 1671 / NRRL Y-8276) TaxID=1071382 RepID=H2ANN2_KAZAF|nr:hypothetical protein KAFR_0A05470 [Kazachstania africana CBS 2517]CCF55982.1 hypothetical protein KAFR_0A05470 [Kazachstania africana CBS 2517]
MLEELISFIVQLPSHDGISKYVNTFLLKKNVIISESVLLNLHTVLYIILFYHAVFLLSIKMFFIPIIKTRNGKCDKRLLGQCGMRVASTLQTLIVLYLSFNSILNRKNDDSVTDPQSRVFYEDRNTQVICLYALGYFIWDTIASYRYSSALFVLHGFVSAWGYYIGLKPYIQYYAPIFLIFEISNPFLNIRWFGRFFFPEWKNLLLVNDLLFIATFFMGRILWGWYQVTLLCIDLWQVRHLDKFNVFDTWFMILIQLSIGTLNISWFCKMCLKAQQILTRSRTFHKSITSP